MRAYRESALQCGRETLSALSVSGCRFCIHAACRGLAEHDWKAAGTSDRSFSSFKAKRQYDTVRSRNASAQQGIYRGRLDINGAGIAVDTGRGRQRNHERLVWPQQDTNVEMMGVAIYLSRQSILRVPRALNVLMLRWQKLPTGECSPVSKTSQAVSLPHRLGLKDATREISDVYGRTLDLARR